MKDQSVGDERDSACQSGEHAWHVRIRELGPMVSNEMCLSRHGKRAAPNAKGKKTQGRPKQLGQIESDWRRNGLKWVCVNEGSPRPGYPVFMVLYEPEELDRTGAQSTRSSDEAGNDRGAKGCRTVEKINQI